MGKTVNSESRDVLQVALASTGMSPFFRLFSKGAFPIVVSLILINSLYSSSAFSQARHQKSRRKVENLKFCSFNIKWLGYLSAKKNVELSKMLKSKHCHIILIQELSSPPASKTLKKFPDGSDIRPSPHATAFFNAMKKNGYGDYLISPEDSGAGDKNHYNDSRTEWHVAFYKKSKVIPAKDLENGYLSSNVTANKDYHRVPYAFSFRTKDKKFDFTLINVHLAAHKSKHKKRKSELEAIRKWVENKEKKSPERDYIIIGDMNIEDPEELADVIPSGFLSLNTSARIATNINSIDPKPYDHAFVKSAKSTNIEIPTNRNFKVYDLVSEMSKLNRDNKNFSGNPLDRVAFSNEYSDHHPFYFHVVIPSKDDD